MTQQLYHYNDQGLFTHQSEASLDPLEQEPTPLVPANSTLIAPPELNDNEAARFSNNEWAIIPDYYGVRYYTPGAGATVITEVGIGLPRDAIRLDDGDQVIQADGQWRLRTEADDLNEAKQDKIADLQAQANAAITDGFESGALGKTHKYDSEQHNIDWIQAAVVSNEDTLITCDNGRGRPDSKQPRNHNPAQSMQILKDGKTALLARKTKFRELRKKVMAAGTTAKVNAINW